jgi:hypothetical protein
MACTRLFALDELIAHLANSRLVVEVKSAANVFGQVKGMRLHDNCVVIHQGQAAPSVAFPVIV